MFSPKSAFFQHAQVQLFVAYRDGRPVGRISAQIDELRTERYADATGHFGVLEAIDDPAVFAALLGAAEEWLRAQGMRRVIGPVQPLDQRRHRHPGRRLRHPPVFLTGHGRRYYDARVQALGYHKAKDVVAYSLDTDGDAAAYDGRVARAAPARPRACASGRSTSRASTPETDVISDDLQRRLGSTTGASCRSRRRSSRELGERAQVPGAARDSCSSPRSTASRRRCCVVVPNLNELIGDLRGRLLPFGWAKLLLAAAVPAAALGARRAHGRAPEVPGQRARGGARVRPDRGDPRLGARASGMQYIEMGWVLEDNFSAPPPDAAPRRPRSTRPTASTRSRSPESRPADTACASPRSSWREAAATGDPLAAATGVAHKALTPVAGVAMLTRVLRTLRATAWIERIVVCGLDPAAAGDLASLTDARPRSSSCAATARRAPARRSRSRRSA